MTTGSAIGLFDQFHEGHKKLLDDMLSQVDTATILVMGTLDESSHKHNFYPDLIQPLDDRVSQIADYVKSIGKAANLMRCEDENEAEKVFLDYPELFCNFFLADKEKHDLYAMRRLEALGEELKRRGHTLNIVYTESLCGTDGLPICSTEIRRAMSDGSVSS